MSFMLDRYVEQELKEFNHIQPKEQHMWPSKIERPAYGAKVQYVKDVMFHKESMIVETGFSIK